jgi:hypothetical protein
MTNKIQNKIEEIKKGCGTKIQIGYNTILNCPIVFQCGLTELCPTCQDSLQATLSTQKLMIEDELEFLEKLKKEFAKKCRYTDDLLLNEVTEERIKQLKQELK